LVLSGGIDINPGLAGGPTEYDNQPDQWQPERDRFEKNLYELAIKNKLPVLGICRGMQLVNVLQGGTLIHDLGELNDQHKKEGTDDKEHGVTIKENTLLNEIVKTGTGDINSAHHQAIGKLGEGLMINSYAGDGTVEGLEWADKTQKPFLLCVQWHPERMFQFRDSPLSKNIRDHFMEEIKKSIVNKNENH
jgi:putative glutamine amidotransferase